MAAIHTHNGDVRKRHIVYGDGPLSAAASRTMRKPKPLKFRDLRSLIAERLRAARETWQVTQAQAARDLGIEPQVLSNYETGKRYPDEAFIVKFCDLTGCPTDWVYRGMLECQMPARMAALIGMKAPHLMRGMGEDAVSEAPSAPAESAEAKPRTTRKKKVAQPA